MGGTDDDEHRAVCDCQTSFRRLPDPPFDRSQCGRNDVMRRVQRPVFRRQTGHGKAAS